MPNLGACRRFAQERKALRSTYYREDGRVGKRCRDIPPIPKPEGMRTKPKMVGCHKPEMSILLDEVLSEEGTSGNV